MHVLAYFDGCPSLQCHPFYHDKKPFFLNKIIIDVIFFTYLYLLYSPLSLQTYSAEKNFVTNNIINY